MRWVEAVYHFCLVAALGIGASVSAQRRPLFGTVVDGKGQPLAGARVQGRFGHQDPPTLGHSAVATPTVPTLDWVETTTDERGRFRLSVFPCVPYRLWACHTKTTADQQNGPLVATTPLVVAASGELVQLRTAAPIEPRKIRIVGVDRWQDVAPLTLRLDSLLETLADGKQHAVRIPIGADGLAVLPPLPESRTHCGICDASGNLIRSSHIPRRSTGTAGSVVSKLDEIRLYQPRTVPMVVVDASGEPVQGATIRQRQRIYGSPTRSSLGHPRGLNPSRETWRTLGTTDARGRLAATISSYRDPFKTKDWQQLFFVAEKPGLSSSHSGFSQSPFYDGEAVPRRGCSEIRFTLRAQEPLAGRLRNEQGEVLANQRIAINFGIRIHIENGILNERRQVSAVTDENGRFEIADAPRDFSGSRIELSGSPLRERIMPPKLLRHTPQDFVALHRLAKRPEQGLDIDLGSMPKLELQLLDAGGGPAAGASVLLVSLASNDIDCTALPWVATSGAGRLAMVVEPGKWLLFVHKDGALAHRNLDVESRQQIELRLEPMSSMRGRVVDSNGQPIANARLANRSVRFQMQKTDKLGIQMIANEFNSLWIESTRSNADGTFVCHYIADPSAIHECVFVQPPSGATGQKESDMFVIAPDGEPKTIVIK